MTEPVNSLWRRAAHESGHVVVGWLHGCEVQGIRIHSGHDDCRLVLPPDVDPYRQALKACLIALGGLEGEALLCGPMHNERGQPDIADFAKELKETGPLFRRWTPEAARLGFGVVTRRLLAANDRHLYALANYVREHRHVFGEDARSVLSLSRKMFGILPSPLMSDEWEKRILKALKVAADQAQRDRDHAVMENKMKAHARRAGLMGMFE